MKKETEVAIPDEMVMTKIYLIRGFKVMLDKDLSEFYGVETKQLKRQVKRNMERFPADFMLELTEAENEALRSQFGTLKRGAHSKFLPYAFTEHGILMLSTVLNSAKAIQASFKIIDVFVRLRKMLTENTELRLAIEKLEKKTENNIKNIDLAFQYINELTVKKKKIQPRKQIGYKIPKKK